jgi:hypothetical protein
MIRSKVTFTSELDAAPEILDGALVFLPVRDKGAEPQTVSVALDGRKPLSRIARIVADRLMLGIPEDLKGVRKARGRVDRSSHQQLRSVLGRQRLGPLDAFGPLGLAEFRRRRGAAFDRVADRHEEFLLSRRRA